MITDQLNAEFGGSAPTDLAIFQNPSNSVVTPNTASRLPGPSNQNGILYNNFEDFQFIYNSRSLGQH